MENIIERNAFWGARQLLRTKNKNMIIIIISAAHIRFSLSYIITSSVCVVLKGRSDSLCGHYTGLAVRAADAVVDGGSWYAAVHEVASSIPKM